MFPLRTEIYYEVICLTKSVRQVISQMEDILLL